MIRYSLVCDSAHEFESWFSTSSGYEDQEARGLVACPVCGSGKVGRAIMAPAVARTDRGRSSPAPAEPAAQPEAAAGPADGPGPVALMGEKEAAVRQMLTALHKHVTDTAEHVGPRFAEEALKIHHGETRARPIYGQADAEDAALLREEGVAFMPLPRLPEAGN